MTRDNIQAALSEMQKNLQKVSRCLDAADRLTDPAKSAELMRSLHAASDQFDAARRALGKATGTAVLFGNRLLQLTTPEQRGPAVQVPDATGTP